VRAAAARGRVGFCVRTRACAYSTARTAARLTLLRAPVAARPQKFFGVSVTKHMSATTRMLLDSLRTMVIWGFSLGVGWESFCYVQLIGFAILLTGTVIYVKVLRVPGLEYPAEEADEAKGVELADENQSQALLLSGGAAEEDVVNA
jgi:hypothetical protein